MALTLQQLQANLDAVDQVTGSRTMNAPIPDGGN
jgi:hypothetical protein